MMFSIKRKVLMNQKNHNEDVFFSKFYEGMTSAEGVDRTRTNLIYLSNQSEERQLASIVNLILIFGSFFPTLCCEFV